MLHEHCLFTLSELLYLPSGRYLLFNNSVSSETFSYIALLILHWLGWKQFFIVPIFCVGVFYWLVLAGSPKAFG